MPTGLQEIDFPEVAAVDAAAIINVLVVDDSRGQRALLCAMLRRWGYQVTEADSGQSALDICAESLPDLVLSDWMMPGMDGLEFCQAFRELPSEKYGYFILLTSKSEKDEVAKGLHSGADDYLSKPINSSELQARITAGERLIKMQRELAKTLQELQGLYDAIDQDLIQAKKIQESLVPELTKSFGESRVSLLLKPCGHVGGDLVGMFSPDSDHLGFYSIDVSGHGITSALMTARVSGYLSGDFPNQNVAMEKGVGDVFLMLPPEEVALRLNDRMAGDVGVVEYFTMAYATVDLRSGSVRMVQAGHPHPLLIRADGSTEFLGAGGVPVGLVQDVEYFGFDARLEKGDKLLLFSDGITEAVLTDGTMLEPEGLIQLVEKIPQEATGPEFLDDLYWLLSDLMVDNKGFDDDVSAALLEFNGQ